MALREEHAQFVAKSQDAERQVQAGNQLLQAAEARAQTAERRAEEAQVRLEALECESRQADVRLEDSERRARNAEQQVADAAALGCRNVRLTSPWCDPPNVLFSVIDWISGNFQMRHLS